MDNQISYISALAIIDKRLDELKEEYGDLPDKVEEMSNNVQKLKSMYEETQSILKDIKHFCSSTKVTLVDLKTKEEKLAKQQFLVRNNKEFDAITKEIEFLREEHSKLSEQLRTEAVKEENLKRILEEQQNNYKKAYSELEELNEELSILESDQNEEVNELNKKRKKIVVKIKKEFLEEYNRVRSFHKDASVLIKRNSCTGCYSSIPPQKIVEIRNNLDQIYSCENCGRVLIPEGYEVDESFINKIK
jgi:hypothetical protein